MANFINQLLGNRPGVVPGASALLSGANQSFNRGFNAFQQVADDLDEVKRNQAIRSLLGSIDMSDPYAAQESLSGGLMGIRGVDPLQAIGLASKAVQPEISRRAEERAAEQAAFKQGMDMAKFNQPDYTTVKDDLGNIYALDKKTGSFKMIQEAPEGAVNPKDIQIVTVTDRDSYGNEITRVIPYNKRTQQPIAPETTGSGNTSIGPAAATEGQAQPMAAQSPRGGSVGTVVSVKRPKLPTSDLEMYDAASTIFPLIDELSGIIEGSPGSFGPIDQYTGSIGAMMGTEEGTNLTRANAISSNLLAGFGKAQMAGVLTDQDMEIIRKQIPQTSDTATEAKEKVRFIRNYLKDKYTQWFNRIGRSNPAILRDIKTPPGFVKQYNPDTGEYRIVPEE